MNRTSRSKTLFTYMAPAILTNACIFLFTIVDGIFVGPLDLSIALGCPMELDAPPMRAALERVVAACQAVHKPVLIFCGDAAAAKVRLSQGFHCVALGVDVLTLIQGFQAMAWEIRG